MLAAQVWLFTGPLRDGANSDEGAYLEGAGQVAITVLATVGGWVVGRRYGGYSRGGVAIWVGR
jgi:hypothetical protein